MNTSKEQSEAESKRDAALKRLLETPPKPHEKKTARDHGENNSKKGGGRKPADKSG